MRHGLGRRAVALLLSWVFTATTAWAGAPPAAAPTGALVPAPLPRLVPPLPAMPARAATTAPDPVEAMATEASLPDALPAPDTQTATASASSCDITFFPPQRYTRTSGPPNVYETTVTVPAWVVSPYTMHVKNGEADGSHRVSSATIEVNGVQVAGPSDFNQNVAGLDRTVTLAPTSTLRVTVASGPGSYLTISFCGVSADKTPPQIRWTEPLPGSATDDGTPHLVVAYQDVKGSDEPAASGVDTDTLRVWLDDVDRTSLFTKRSGDASADLPESLALAEGPHHLKARIRDRAGNQAEAVSDFRVDRTKPWIKVVEPPSGAYLGVDAALVRIQYRDETALDLGSLVVLVNGTDRTALFSKGSAEAVGTVDTAAGLRDGANQVSVRIKDQAGNEATDAAGFNVDRKPPTLAIGQPAAGSRHGTSDVEVIIEYADDQALDLRTFAVTVDDQTPVLSQGPDGAMGRVSLSDGSHTLTAEIQDKAGNRAAARSDFTVDTKAPTVEVLAPPAGFTIRDPMPFVLVHYHDEDGVDLGTLRVTIDGVDRTALFPPGTEYASGRLPAEARLAEGANTITAEIRDLTGNLGHGESSFTVDSVPPSGQFEAPRAKTNERPLPIRVTYSDAGSGVDPALVKLFVDGQEWPGVLTADAGQAEGLFAPAPPLAEGPHDLRVHLADRAGNEADITMSFVLDTIPPAVLFEAPANDSFINDSKPEVRIGYDDGAGTGVDTSTLRVFFKKGTDDEVDVTEALSLEPGPAGAVGRVPEALLDGTYHLRAQVADAAGNAGTGRSAFELDTVPPTVVINAPAAGGFVATRTPVVEMRYQDVGTGVDPARLVVKVDGTDVAAALQKDASEAKGALPPDQALGEGGHLLEVTVVDRAGNATAPAPQGFVVDTIPPTAAAVEPADQSFVGTPLPHLRFSYGDGSGSGIDLGSVVVAVDGGLLVPGFPAGPDGVEGTAPTALADGLHTALVRVKDQAGNETSALTRFWVDTQAPALSRLSLPDTSYVMHVDPSGQIEVTGTVQDLDPGVRLECRNGGRTVAARIENGQFTCGVPLDEGVNSVDFTATDRTGHATTERRKVTLDTHAPDVAILQPLPGDYTNATDMAVSGTVADETPTTVRVEGIEAEVQGDFTEGARTLHTFVARNVPVSEGPQVTLHATATDAAGNAAAAAVTINVDRVPPAVQITKPLDGAYVRGPMVEVEGRVDDASPVGVEVNGQPEEPPPAFAAPRSFRAQVPVAEGSVPVRATARDAAGNVGQAVITVVVDSTPPVIRVTSPPPGLVTAAAAVHLEGTIDDASPIASFTVRGQPAPFSGHAFSLDVPMPEGQDQVLGLAATDAAGNTGTAEARVSIDRTPPLLMVVSPAEGATLGGLPVVVQGTVQDLNLTRVTVNGLEATVTGMEWHLSFPSLAEGPQAFAVRAEDAAGNHSDETRHATLDLGAPFVKIRSPQDGAITREATVTVAGDAQDLTLQSVVVTVNGGNGVAAAVGNGQFTATVALAEGADRVVARATDGFGRVSENAVMVTLDSTPPVVTLQAPDRISRGKAAQAVAQVTDAGVGVDTVVLKVNGETRGTFTAPPYQIDLVVPDSAVSGDTLTVVAEAVDRAGNQASVSVGVKVAAEGVIVGQVLDDGTSLPLAGVTVRMLGSGGGADVTTTTDERGRYSLPAGEAQAQLAAELPGRPRVEREVAVASGVGTVAVDARLTPLADPVTVGPDGKTLTATAASSTITVTVPAGALSADTAVSLTPLSAQGLPGLLPLGWSPLAAFDLAALGSVNVAVPLEVTVAGLAGASAAGGSSGGSGGTDALPSPVHLVTYRPALHEWVMQAPGLVPTAATDTAPASVDTSIPGLGAYALVVPDDADLQIPRVGEVLPAADMMILPPTATSAGVVEPAVIPPTGGTAVGKLTVLSPVPLPSGTVIQARVLETFTLASGDVASSEDRVEDIVLFRTPAPEGAALAASIPITPSRTFEPTELSEGKVRLKILSGRETTRGETGGAAAVQLDVAGASLSVPAGAVPVDTVVSLEAVDFSAFLPSAAGLQPLAEVVVDFAGVTLGKAAELSVAAGSATVGDTLLVARVERLNGIPRLAVVALAALEADRVVTKPYAGLPGLTREGRYVVYRSASAVGFLTGTTTAGGTPAKAIVETAGLPFVALGDANGHYVAAAVAGQDVTATARVPGTSLAGSGHATAEPVPAPATPLDIALAGTVTTASVAPADGSVALETNVQVEITAPTPLNPATVTGDNVKLLMGTDTVPTRLVLSSSGTFLAVVPQAQLDFGTTFTLQASGLADAFGGLVSVPTVHFTTKDNTPPVYNTNALTFSFPDENGLVHVTAPAGSLPPGTTVLVINSGNGFVASFTAENDGAVGVILPATFPASISDRLQITLQDPQGNVTTFERGKYVAPDGTTAVNATGGVVEGSGGVELRIPEGALDKGVALKIASVTPEELEALFPGEPRPELSGATLGSALKIDSGDAPVFKKEVKLAFPKPEAAPEGAFYYVYRRLTDAEGKLKGYETADHAFIEGSGDKQKVVTASYPFRGYMDSAASFGVAGLFASSVNTFLLLWSVDATPEGRRNTGAITGKVLRVKFKPVDPNKPGSQNPEYEAVAGAVVARLTASGKPRYEEDPNAPVAVSQADGTYALFDADYREGTVDLVATKENQSRTAKAFLASFDDVPPSLKSYRSIATANITFPPIEPPPPPPAIDIRVMRLVAGKRQTTDGVVAAGTPLIIGFSAKNAEVRGATLRGQELGIRVDPLKGQDPLAMDVILNVDSPDGTFTPSDPGSYTVTATALPITGDNVVTASSTFRVVGAGGGIDNLPDVPPRIITARTVPKAGATGVPVSIYPQLYFTEPVKGVFGSVKLVEADTGQETPVVLQGVAPDGTVQDLTNRPDIAVTSVTLQPRTSLRYKASYKLVATDGIVDLDQPPKTLLCDNGQPPCESDFTTFGPEAVGGTADSFATVGLVVLQDRAYVVDNSGLLHAYDVSDPVTPAEKAQVWVYGGFPQDLAGDLDDGSVTGREGARLLAVLVRSVFFGPQDLLLFDASTDDIRLVGAASLTRSLQEGASTRLVVKGGFAYVITVKKGIQVVDLSFAKANLDRVTGGDLNSPAFFDVLRKMAIQGQGFFPETTPGIETPLVATIPYKGQVGAFSDLDALDTDSGRMVLAVGYGTGLAVARAATGEVLFDDVVYWKKLRDDGTEETLGSISNGSVVAGGRLGDKTVALIVGSGEIGGAAGNYLGVASLQEPSQPRLLSMLALQDTVSDILIKDDFALLASEQARRVTVVSLTNPSQPRIIGIIPNVGGRLALGENNLLFSTARGLIPGTDPLGGVRTAALGNLTLITDVKEDPVLLAEDRKSIEPQAIKYRAISPREQIETAELEILKQDAGSQQEAVAQRFNVSLADDGTGSFTLPAGLEHTSGKVVKARLVVNRLKPDAEKLPASERLLKGEAFDLEPSGPETVAINGEPLEVAAVNAALLDRLEKDPDAAVPALTWDGLGLMLPTPPGSAGIYSGELAAFGPAGVGEIRLMKDSTVLARTGPLTVTPGPAFHASLSAGPPLQSPGGIAGLVPADGKSEVVLTLEDVRDDGNFPVGNLVEDGTPVAWSMVEGDGQLLDTDNSVTTGGRASIRYRAGIEPGAAKIRAAIPHPAFGEITRDVVVTQAKLLVKVKDQWPLIEATVDSEGAGLPANGAEVGWISGRGRLTAQEELTGGRALALWTDWSDAEMRPGPWRGRFIPIGATVGRARDGFMYDTQRSIDTAPRSGIKLRLGSDRLAPPQLLNSPYPTTTSIEVVGGEPGVTVRLVLGSSRFPEVEPIAAYSFDAITVMSASDAMTVRLAPDVYGRYPGSVSGDVALDTSDQVHAPATYRFSGAGQVSIPHAEAFGLRNDLGFNGWVYFDSLTPGQKVLEKAGAYGLQLVKDAGDQRLEFYVLSGGQRAHVLSHDPVVAGTWLQFAAQFRSGMLTLALGSSDNIAAVGDSSGPADASTAPLVIGSGLMGRLDEVAVYDFKQQPFVAFPGGGTEKVLTLDDNGAASVDIEALDTFATSSGPIVLPPAGSPEEGFRQRLRTPPVRIYEAPQAAERDESFTGSLKVETEQSIKNCGQGIGTGEGELWSQQTACDVSLGLLPGATTPQAARDFFISGAHLVRGNRSVGTFIKIGLSLAILGASLIPGGGDIGKVFSKVRLAVTGTKAEAVLAREALEKVELLAKTPGIVVHESGVARVLAAEGGDVAAQDALRLLLGICETSTCLSLTEDAIHGFERVGARFGHEELAKSLGALAQDGRFGMDVVERMVGALDRTPTIGKLSTEALEGLAVFIKHAKGEKRLWRLWDELTNAAFHGLPPEQAQQVAERLFGMLKQGDARFAQTAWWHNFIALGAGTSRSHTSTRGFFHALEQILKEAPEAIISVDTKAAGYLGRPDLLVRVTVRGAEGIVQKEFKAIGAGRLLSDADIGQLRRIIKAAKDRAVTEAARRGGVPPSVVLREELQRLVYIFRGQVREELKQQLKKEAQKVLRGELRSIADDIYGNIQFVGALPF